ncbi:MAG: NosD domain-containing protein [Halobacteriota archaeon]
MERERRKFGMVLAFTVLFIILAFVSAGCASATTIYVPDNYPTIQAAVNAANPGDTIIVRDGTYTGTVNVNKRLTIHSENGSDSTIVQAGSANGFYVTADYVNISGFTVECGAYKSGIDLHGADHCNISNNNVSNNYAAKGVYLVQSSNNLLTSNNISNNWRGIYLDSSSNNLLANNSVNSNYGDNIFMLSSSNNILRNNTVSGSNDGVNMYSSNGNILTNNNVSNNNYGIWVSFSSNSNITNNTVKSNTDVGIWLGYSSNNTLTNNMLSGNNYNFGVEGDTISEYVHNIDTSNKVNGKPIYYWINREDQQIPNDAGFVGIVNSTNITVRDLILIDNYEGVLFANAKNSRIENVSVSNGRYGIYLFYSSNNTIKNNTANSNSWDSIHMSYSSNNIVTNNTANAKNATYSQGISLLFSSKNSFYLNNFLNNNQNAYSENSTNFWNSTEPITYTYYGIEHTNYLGNYWDDYTGSDANYDGIGDSTYSIGSDKDNYPLMEAWENYFAPAPSVFDTGAGTYPSIMGIHKGEIKPSHNISVSKLYTYPCVGTGGHTESIKLYKNGELIASGTWTGYHSDYHNITITPSVILQAGQTYNYTIVTGSYPQIIHEPSKEVTGGTITCTLFTDANGKTYTDWIPAIRLE